MFSKKEKAVVNFETENWAVRKYAPIKPASEFMPGPWKQMPTFTDKQKHKIACNYVASADCWTPYVSYKSLPWLWSIWHLNF